MHMFSILIEPQSKKKNLTLNRVVEISAFKISGSYLVLDEEPENTFKGRREGEKKKSDLYKLHN